MEQTRPRVSTILQVLDDAYAGVPQALLDAAAERGERLHRLCLSYLASLDGLCVEPVPTPQDVAAYAGFQAWVKTQCVCPVAVEQGSVSTKHRYQGTPDALVLCDSVPTLIDLKFTAVILRINRVQIQAYRRLDLYADAKRSLLLHINPVTGEVNQRIIPNNPGDWAAFLNALSVWRWRQA